MQHIMIFLSDVADMETANMEADDRDNVFIICMPEEGVNIRNPVKNTGLRHT